jgi:NTE family protein
VYFWEGNKKMRAFVLSGGGNRGAFQVGALRALLECDVYPDMLVGCSAGALNAAFLAREVSLEQVEKMAETWRNIRKDDIYPGGHLSILWRLICGEDSLFDNCNFYEFLQRNGSMPGQTFGDLSKEVPAYITATHLDSERLHVFGDDPSDSVLDALMASTALPPMHPPWIINDECYIDGGTVTPLPLRVAIERGATEIFALHIWEEPKPMGTLRKGVATMIDRSISAMLRFQAQHDLMLIERVNKHVKVHEIRLHATDLPGLNDFSQSDRLYTVGHELTMTYLTEILSESNWMSSNVHPPLKRLGRKLARGWVQLVSSTRDNRMQSVQTVPVPVSTQQKSPQEHLRS